MYFLKQGFGGMELQWNLPRFIKNIFICVLKTNESLMGFWWVNCDTHFIFRWTVPLTKNMKTLGSESQHCKLNF